MLSMMSCGSMKTVPAASSERTCRSLEFVQRHPDHFARVPEVEDAAALVGSRRFNAHPRMTTSTHQVGIALVALPPKRQLVYMVVTFNAWGTPSVEVTSSRSRRSVSSVAVDRRASQHHEHERRARSTARAATSTTISGPS